LQLLHGATGVELTGVPYKGKGPQKVNEHSSTPLIRRKKRPDPFGLALQFQTIRCIQRKSLTGSKLTVEGSTPSTRRSNRSKQKPVQS
jgi:hypothetical protein